VITVENNGTPFAPISRQSMFMNVMRDEDKINYLIEKLFKFADEFGLDSINNKISSNIGAVV